MMLKGIDDYLTAQTNPEEALHAIENTATGLLDFLNPDHRYEIIRALSFIQNPIELELLSKATSKKIGISHSTMKGAILETKQQRAEENQPTAFSDDMPEPSGPEPVNIHPEPVAGNDLLNELFNTYAMYVVLPEHGATTLSLWTLHTYMLDAAEATPILAIESPEKRCGKTRLMSVLSETAYETMAASNISPASLFRSMEKWRPTLLIDEGDSFLKDNEELRGVLNSGHTRSTAYVIRCQGDEHEPTKFSTWGAKAIALIGKLSGTLEDRSIVIAMRRKKKGEGVERLRLDRDKATFLAIRQKCTRFAKDNIEALIEADPSIPDMLHDRAADNWRPLIAIADLGGGEWSIKARQAALALSGMVDDNEAAGILLLRDIHEYFPQSGTDRVLTAHLIEHLSTLEEHPWAGWNRGKPINPRQIAKLLTPFSIISKDIRCGDERGKGYRSEDFEDAFSRYLPSMGNLSVTTGQTNIHAGLRDFSSVTPGNDVTANKNGKPNIHAGCHGVTDKKGGDGGIDAEIIEMELSL